MRDSEGWAQTFTEKAMKQTHKVNINKWAGPDGFHPRAPNELKDKIAELLTIKGQNMATSNSKSFFDFYENLQLCKLDVFIEPISRNCN